MLPSNVNLPMQRHGNMFVQGGTCLKAWNLQHDAAVCKCEILIVSESGTNCYKILTVCCTN